jgi:hypothetical protein
MHSYASDGWTRGPQVYFVLGVIAIAVASGLDQVVTLLASILPPWLNLPLDPGALSAGTIYGLLILVFNRWVWAWPRDIPDLRGTWCGTITSSFNDGSVTVCVMRIRQNWTRIGIRLETSNSVSETTMAAFTEAAGEQELKYEYWCKPRNLAVDTMVAHAGNGTLRFSADGKSLIGDYFTGRGRRTEGRIDLRWKSRKMLDWKDCSEIGAA